MSWRSATVQISFGPGRRVRGSPRTVSVVSEADANLKSLDDDEMESRPNVRWATSVNARSGLSLTYSRPRGRRRFSRSDAPPDVMA